MVLLMYNGYMCSFGLQVSPAKGNNTVVIGGKELELVQWHFHTPSEHAFDGERKSMEVHLVHKDPENGTLPLLDVDMFETMPLLLLMADTGLNHAVLIVLVHRLVGIHGHSCYTSVVSVESECL